ncbi:MAG TPA: AMP-binding protein, partial [Mycobacteriales bacterium]|nr:AMP-binding protein [Mycobacteriales bacterium]
VEAIDVGGRKVPPPGAADLVAPNAAALLRRNATEHGDRPAVRWADGEWTYAELWAEMLRWAGAFEAHRPADPATPFHIGVLLDNTPAYLACIGAAAVTGATLVGLNPTRMGAELARDASHTDCVAVVTDGTYDQLLTDAGIALPTVTRGPDTDTRWVDDPSRDPDISTRWLLVLTSGTSSAPKAVICSQRRMLVTGERMRILLDVDQDDVGYICMPLFHSNALMVGMMPAWVSGACLGLAPKFSARGWLPDVRRYGVTYWNYTGKPLAYLLATEEKPDDADNTVTRAYGNEGSATIVAAFSKRFGVEVIDGFGPTEGGIGIMRKPEDPDGAIGHCGDHVMVVDVDGNQLPKARFDAAGQLTNAAEAVGEIVNTAGPGPFEGYWRNEEATQKATRNGWYWTGDLGYVDDAGFVYFAGRNADWVRVDGENFPTGPVEAVVARHPDVVASAAYGIPAPDAGDALMCALVLNEGATFDPAAFAAWLDEQPDLGPKWRPTWVRITDELPRTPTHKVLHRQLQQEKFRLDLVRPGDMLFRRPRGSATFMPFGADEQAALAKEFEAAGRTRFWDL